MSIPDWGAIEHEYRAGKLSIRAIAGKYGVSDRGIGKKAKKLGWVYGDLQSENGSHSEVRTKQNANHCEPKKTRTKNDKSPGPEPG